MRLPPGGFCREACLPCLPQAGAGRPGSLLLLFDDFSADESIKKGELAVEITRCLLQTASLSAPWDHTGGTMVAAVNAKSTLSSTTA